MFFFGYHGQGRWSMAVFSYELHHLRKTRSDDMGDGWLESATEPKLRPALCHLHSHISATEKRTAKPSTHEAGKRFLQAAGGAPQRAWM